MPGKNTLTRNNVTCMKTNGGTCYIDVLRFALDQPDSTVVHGRVFSTHFDQYIIHAWIETDTGFIWEPHSNKFFTPEQFECVAKPVIHKRYTTDEAAILALKTKHAGPWEHEPIDLTERLPYTSMDRYPELKSLYMSPEWVGLHEQIPRYVYHVPKGKVSFDKVVRAYPIREIEAAGSFGKGYRGFEYIWLSIQPIYGVSDAYIIDITYLNNANLRFTGQAEGHLLHKGDIYPDAVVAIRKSTGKIKYRI